MYQSHHSRNTVQSTLNASIIVTFMKVSELPPLGCFHVDDSLQMSFLRCTTVADV
jgi:hypothetical protein